VVQRLILSGVRRRTSKQKGLKMGLFILSKQNFGLAKQMGESHVFVQNLNRSLEKDLCET